MTRIAKEVKMKNTASILTATAAGLVLSTAAFAADLPSKSAPAAAAPAAAAVSLDNTLQVEIDPEFRISNSGINKGKVANAVVDDAAFVKYSHTFMGQFVVSGLLQGTNRVGNGGGSSIYQSEIGFGYKYAVGNGVTVTPGVSIGEAWGATKFGSKSNTAVPFATAANTANSSETYYAATLNVDWKINDQFTWNVLGLRYRDAFNAQYNTPKASTGVTYALSKADAVYVVGGYAWKNLYSNSIKLSNEYADKFNVGLGFKHSF